MCMTKMNYSEILSQRIARGQPIYFSIYIQLCNYMYINCEYSILYRINSLNIFISVNIVYS